MTALGAPLVVKTLTFDCPGDCCGVITLTTDLVHAAYAVTEDASRHLDADAEVAREGDGLAVTCRAYEPVREETCDAVVTLDRQRLNAETWVASAAHVAYMQPLGA